MSEMQPLQNENHDKRPIGRFLLALENDDARHDIYDYASHFADNYRDILKPKSEAYTVAVEEVKGRRIELQFLVNRQKESTYGWRLQSDREQYEISCTRDSCEGMHYEFTSQGALLHRRSVGSLATLRTLQGTVESMTNTLEFHRHTSAIRGDKTRTQAAIRELEAQPRRSHGEEKNLQSLRGHLFEAGFPVGSRDVSKLIPLLGD